MLKVQQANSFIKANKVAKKKRRDSEKLKAVVRLLQAGEPLAGKHRDHALSGDLQGYRECHIERDWLLMYRIVSDTLILVDHGSHDDLFKTRKKR